MSNKLLTTIIPCAILLTAALVVPASANGLTEVTIKTSQTASTVDSQTTKTISLDANKPNVMKPQKTEAFKPDPPLLVSVSIDDQMLTVFRGTDPIKNSIISSGKQGHSTPTGLFSILGKRKYHKSNIYSNAPMPYMQRLTWSGIALHESGSVPRYPASHGCVRLPRGFAKSLFSTTPRGTHVIISREAVRPSRVDHPSLFQSIKSQPKLASLRLGITDYQVKLSKTVDNDQSEQAPLRIYITRTTRREKVKHLQFMLNKMGYHVGEPDGLYGPKTIALVKQYQRVQGLKATGTMTDEIVKHLLSKSKIERVPPAMIYVRQNQTPIFEAPIELREPKKPLGTHLFLTTAQSAETTGWLSVSIASKLPRSVIRDHAMEKSLAGKRIRMDVEDALNNVVISDDVREFIEARLNKNSSFAISDNGLGTETGAGTDFIVQTH